MTLECLPILEDVESSILSALRTAYVSGVVSIRTLHLALIDLDFPPDPSLLLLSFLRQALCMERVSIVPGDATYRLRALPWSEIADHVSFGLASIAPCLYAQFDEVINPCSHLRHSSLSRP